MPEPVISLKNVCKEFSAISPVHALSDVSLSVNLADYVAVVGPSGSGKSTLLNVLGLLDRPSSGSYKLNGIETTELRDSERTRLRGGQIGFIFQSFHLLAHRSVLENVMLAEIYQSKRARAERIKPVNLETPVTAGTAKRIRKDRKARALQVLKRVSLSHRVDFLPDRLSGGERQRAAIARALMGEPSLLLCDEPTGNLDSHNTAAILDLFDDLRDQGLTIVVITHENEVSDRAKRRVRIIDGVLAEE